MEKPVFTCPADITLETEEGKPHGIPTLPMPSVTDNSRPNDPLEPELITPHPNGEYPIGDNTVMYTVMDASGNHADCSFHVVINGKILQICYIAKQEVLKTQDFAV